MKKCISDYLKQTQNLYGNKIAFKDCDTEVTFAQVDQMSCAIATYMINKGYYEKPILVMSSRSVFTPICHIGVARAGCFYVPMDVTNPEMRLNQIIDIAMANILIVDKKNYEIAKKLEFTGEILVLEDLIKETADEEIVLEVENKITDTMPLYVIFTSGSTGVPKGVTTSHHAVMSYIDAVTEVMKISENDVLGNQSPMDYIAAVRDIYIPLKTGATTYIIPSNEFAVPEALFKTLDENNVTTICWSAAGLELCVKVGLFECGIPKKINKILFSGSIISAKALMEWQKALPMALFVNQYGPTEATASCTYYIVKEKANECTVLPIGKPFKNYKIILLDEENKEIIDDKIGEICVSGPTISLGYYNNEEATQKVFVQNPLNHLYREIIYRTGDLGKRNKNGELEFCGRIDRQVKHMGHRIELEEIEWFGKTLEGIQEDVAFYDKEKSILYFIYVGNVTIRDVALYFRKNMPAYMVPRKIFQVNTIAKLPNGKVNVKEIEKEYIK